MGANSMQISVIRGDGAKIMRRKTRLHGQLRCWEDIDTYDAAFTETAKLCEPLGLDISLVRGSKGLPEITLLISDGDMTYKLIATHTIGRYDCWRDDGGHYKMTELDPKKLLLKIKKYFGFNAKRAPKHNAPWPQL